MIFQNIAIKIHLFYLKQKIFILVKKNENELGYELGELGFNSLIVYFLSEYTRIDEDIIIVELEKANFFRDYYLLNNDIQFQNKIQKNFRNHEFWNNEFIDEYKKHIDLYTDAIDKYLNGLNLPIDRKKIQEFVKSLLVFFTIDLRIEKFTTGVFKLGYEQNIEVFKIQLEYLKKLKKIVQELLPKNFNKTCTAINLLAKNKI